MSSRLYTFLLGMRTGIPIVLAYLPVGFAFGASASGLGLVPFEITSISALMFSGATQAFCLGAIASGMSVATIIGICAALSMRHILYGFVLRSQLKGNLATRLAFAFGLTDEVFATALSACQKSGTKPGGSWLLGLAFSAWISWVAATFMGAWLGNILQMQFPQFSEALHFALLALFLGLVWASANRRYLLPMIAGAIIAVVLLTLNLPSVAIPGAALGALLVKGEKA